MWLYEHRNEMGIPFPREATFESVSHPHYHARDMGIVYRTLNLVPHSIQVTAQPNTTGVFKQ